MVLTVESSGPHGAQFVGGPVGLAASANASAGAGHHFDEVIRRLLACGLGCADLVDHLLDVGQSVGHGDTNGLAGHLDGAFLDPGQPARHLELDLGSVRAGDIEVRAAKRCFHHPAGHAEDRSRAGVHAENVVARLVGNGDKVDARLLDHARKLTRGDRHIHILIAGGGHLLAADDLGLLRRAGHDRDHVHLGRIDPLLLGVVGLGERANHGVRRLATGEVRDHVAVELLHEVDPAGAASGDQRQHPLAVQQARFELGGLFDDGQIGAEVGVEDRLEAHAAKRRIDLAGQVCAHREAKGLAHGHAHRGRNLRDAVRGRVFQLLPHLHRLVVLHDGPGGAVRGALAATHARRVGQRNVPGCGDARLEPAIQEAERPHILVLLAHLDAPAACDALARVQHNAARRVVDCVFGNDAVQARPRQTKIGGQGLQLAVLVAQAGQALVGVPRQNQLQHRAPHIDDLRRFGQNVHLVFDGRATRAQHLARVLDLHDADSAGRRGIQVGMLA